MKAQCRLCRRNYHNFKSNKYAALTANIKSVKKTKLALRNEKITSVASF